MKNGKFVLGNIYGNKSKTFTLLFEPLTCSKAADIKCQVNYADHEGKMISLWMEPKEISVICPIMKTDQNINIGRLKEFIEKLPNQDSRVYEVQSGFDVKKLAALAREVVEKHDIRYISTLHTRDGKTCEIWYYGRTKVNKDDIVIKVAIFTELQTMELFAATPTAEALTGLLAEVGRGLKDAVESNVSGKGRVVNVSINKSKIDRSNLLDLCNMNGICDINVVIEKSEIDRSIIGSSEEHDKSSPKDDHTASTRKKECPICFNQIDSSNKSLLCKKCGERFCQTCESWYREPRKTGESPWTRGVSLLSEMKNLGLNKKRHWHKKLSI